jgi:hypothetical protein
MNLKTNQKFLWLFVLLGCSSQPSAPSLYEGPPQNIDYSFENAFYADPLSPFHIEQRSPASNQNEDEARGNVYQASRRQILILLEKDIKVDTGKMLYSLAKEIKNPTHLIVLAANMNDRQEIRTRRWLLPDRSELQVLDRLSPEEKKKFITHSDLVIMRSDEENHDFIISLKKPIIYLDEYCKSLATLAPRLAYVHTGIVNRYVDRIGAEAVDLLFVEKIKNKFLSRQNTALRTKKPLQNLIIEAPPLEEVPSKDFEDLQAEERRLKIVRANLLNLENDWEDEFKLLKQNQQLTSQFIAKLNESPRVGRNQSNTAAYIANTRESLRAFHATGDNLIQSKFDYLIDRSWLEVRQMHLRVQLELKKTKKTKILSQLDSIYRTLRDHLGFYRKNRYMYGAPLEYNRRVAPYTQFFATLSKYLELVRKRTEVNLEEWGGAPGARGAGVLELAYGLGFIPNLPSAIHELVSNRDRALADNTPLTHTLDSLVKRAAHSARINVKIADRGRLEASPDKQIITIYTLSHRNAMRDLVLMANLNLENYLLVAAGYFYPNMVARALYKDSNFIFVGRQGGEPMQQILQSLRIGQSNKIVIYPEGALPMGLEETHPIRPNFSKSLITGLRKAGYLVRIVPVTWVNGATFFDTTNLTGAFGSDLEKNLRGAVSIPIENETLDLIYKKGDDLMLADLIRMSWLENFETNSKKFLGLVRTTAAEAELARLFQLKSLQ